MLWRCPNGSGLPPEEPEDETGSAEKETEDPNTQEYFDEPNINTSTTTATTTPTTAPADESGNETEQRGGEETRGSVWVSQVVCDRPRDDPGLVCLAGIRIRRI